MKETLYWLAKHTGIFALCRWLTRKNIRILGYHGIWLGKGHFGNFLYMNPEKFIHRMSLLSKWKYPVISLDQAIANRDSGTLPDCTTVITIDDGWYGTYLYMLPALKKYHFPATVYITSYYSEKQVPVFDVALQYMVAMTERKEWSSADLIDFDAGGDSEIYDLTSDEQRSQLRERLQSYVSSQENEDTRQKKMHQIGGILGVFYSKIIEHKLFHLMTTQQVADLHSQGIDIQLHTHRHRVSHQGQDCSSQEIQDNRKSLEPLTSASLVHFCYPSGLYDESVWPQLEIAGIVSATTTETGLVNDKSHQYALPRILDGEQVSDLAFEAELVGLGEIKRKLMRVIGKNN